MIRRAHPLLLLSALLLLAPMLWSEEAAKPPVLLFVGDSITAGFGLQEEEAYPALLSQDLLAHGLQVRVVNAGLSGDTLRGGLGRLPWLLRQEPRWLVIALGANDGLRGLPLADSEKALREMVRLGQEAGAKVILFGIDLPSNYGDRYRQEFRQMFRQVADDKELPLLPFFIEGVAMKPELNLADRIHPNAEGQRVVANTVRDFLLPILDPDFSPAEETSDDPAPATDTETQP
ncbi:MAG: arylesterase [Planctomycetota bacterium]|nr:MAG: arylesterase [Planctomycetota bacterium]